ncbi:mitochondrial carrier domain-containing protein [Fimicolochytrium jonesii]|uniref:mitochondrial carrier domain-containing protein n=1 Tax=Fimicolochytrium jonesii TaxID=1396493 RepID=UPI0022FEBF61|nr:mitochondrial carrier domain-containing protein [Fimicolochytrium jonesii]KAI8824529.1 mitochondrial carrier domain-containing protein [Fimicolochytrium jonesii]
MSEGTASTPFWVTIVASAIAAVIARGSTHPLDTLKVRLQTAIAPPHSSTSTRHAHSDATGLYGLSAWGGFWFIVRNEGIGSLYKGFSTGLIFAVPAIITYLSTYEWTKTHLGFVGDPATSSIIHLLAGALAELLSNVFWCPMEVIKSRQQAQVGSGHMPTKLNAHPSMENLSNIDDDADIPLHTLTDDFDSPIPQSPTTGPTAPSTFTLILSLYARQGLPGFFVGFWLGILVYLPYSILYFILYEQLKLLASHNTPSLIPQLSGWAIILCSGVAGSIAAAVTNPLEVPKVAYQVDEGRRETFWAIVKGLWRREGWRGFWRGVGARVAWMGPTHVVQFWVYESFRGWLTPKA